MEGADIVIERERGMGGAQAASPELRSVWNEIRRFPGNPAAKVQPDRAISFHTGRK